MYAATVIQKAWSLTKGMKMTTLTIASSIMVKEIAELKLIASAQRNGRRTLDDAGATAEWGLGALRYSRSFVRTSYQKSVRYLVHARRREQTPVPYEIGAFAVKKA